MCGRRGKILCAHQIVGGLVHQRIVQSATHLCTERMLKGVFASGNTIVVGARNGIESCVCVGGYREEVINSDGGWEKAVEAIHSLRALIGEERRIEMGIHHLGMYACIGAPCKCEGYRLTKNSSHSVLHHILHRTSGRL